MLVSALLRIVTVVSGVVDLIRTLVVAPQGYIVMAVRRWATLIRRTSLLGLPAILVRHRHDGAATTLLGRGALKAKGCPCCCFRVS